MTEKTAQDWQEPDRAEDGTYLTGESKLPVNHRLRAETLVRAGKSEDPDGIIGTDLIADTAARLADEDKAAKAAKRAASATQQAPQGE
jgi:hypothetical protein